MTSTVTPTTVTTPPAPSLVRRLAGGLGRALLTPHPSRHWLRSAGIGPLDGPLTDPSVALVTAVDRSTPDVTVLRLALPAGARRPAPGGALALGVVVDGVVHRRHYSPVDSAHSGARELTLAVRRHPGGLVSEELWAHAEPGTRLLLEGVVGEAVLPATRPRDVLLVSGGSGLTPMLAIASTLADEHHAGRVAWLHYAPHPGAVPLRPRLDALAHEGVDVRIVPTRPGAGTPAADGPTGHLTAEHVTGLAPWHADAEVFVCGPDPLAEALACALGDRPDRPVRRERFTAARPATPSGATGGTVTHRLSGVTAANDGDTLLDGAEAAGLRPAHGCRMGICHTCTAVRRSGATVDLRTGVVDDEPDVRVQICVSAPVGDVDIDL